MPAPPRVPRSFREILELIWWRLDQALDLEMIRWSAKLGALEALERGTTAIIDHHASPMAIEGSLAVIAEACREVGVRIATCSSDDHRLEGAKAGLAENERHLKSSDPTGPRFVGAHACFTLSDETLDAVCSLASELDAGVHIHVAEGPEDVEAGKRLEFRSRESWLLAHAVHLDASLHDRPNPLNMDNSVLLSWARRTAVSP
jgi:cytosine/adenosine deaminase-related metal-dependent hydrolase